MDLSLTTVYACGHLEVIGILDDGWSWILAWLKLGVNNIFALPLTELEFEKLNSVKEILK